MLVSSQACSSLPCAPFLGDAGARWSVDGAEHEGFRRLILEETLEGDVSDALERDRYERSEGDGQGYRNGYRGGRMKTAEGIVEFSAPQVRDTPEPFVSAIRENLSGRTEALEDLAVELYARGLSTRDIEDAFKDETGRRLLSRAAVSEIRERLWAEYEVFAKRDLSEHRIVYLYVDCIAERLRPGQPRKAVIAAWGIGDDGGPWRTACATSPSRCRATCGRSSRRASPPATKHHRGRCTRRSEENGFSSDG
jgi:transposase-like protein